jgi:hypothetical protein
VKTKIKGKKKKYTSNVPTLGRGESNPELLATRKM